MLLPMYQMQEHQQLMRRQMQVHIAKMHLLMLVMQQVAENKLEQLLI
jgi:hypothetical protein